MLSSPEVNFELHGTSLDVRSTSPAINYPAKLRISLENKGHDVVHLLAPRWITAVGNVSVQCGTPIYPNVPYKPNMQEFGYRYQLERSLGSWKDDEWKSLADGKDDEHQELYIEPGWSFRIWIGLNPMVPHDVLEDRRRRSRLGTLVLPVVIGNQQSEWAREI